MRYEICESFDAPVFYFPVAPAIFVPTKHHNNKPPSPLPGQWDGIWRTRSSVTSAGKMSEYSFSTASRPRPSSFIPRPTMPPPTLKKPPSKPENSSQSRSEKGSNKVRRLSSLSQLAKSFGRRKEGSEEISDPLNAGKRVDPTNAAGQSLAVAPQGSRRSSPHPSKAILPRSSTTSNLPVPSPVSTAASPVGPLASSKTVTKFTSNMRKSPSMCATSDKANRRLSLQPRAMQFASSTNVASFQSRTSAGNRKKVQRYSLSGSTFALDWDKENFSAPHFQDEVPVPRKWSYNSNNSNNSVRSSIEESRKQLRQSIDDLFPMITPKATKSQAKTQVPVDSRDIVTPTPRHGMDVIEDESPRSPVKDHGIVHHQLMKTLSPSDVQKTSKVLSPVTSDRGTMLAGGVTSVGAMENERLKPRNVINPFASVLTAITRRQSQGNVASPLSSPSELSPDRLIYKAQPSAFWTGRFISLNDRLMNESMKTAARAVERPQPTGQGREQLRIRKIFAILEDQCKTKAAQKSLTHFKAQFAIIKKMPELLIAPLSAGLKIDDTYGSRDCESSDSHYSDSSRIDSEMLRVQTKLLTDTLADLGKPDSETTVDSQTSEVTQSSVSKGRKTSFMEKLMGKGKRLSDSTYKE